MVGQELAKKEGLTTRDIVHVLKRLFIFWASLIALFLVVTDKSIQNSLIMDFQTLISSSSSFLLGLFAGHTSSEGIYLTYKNFTVGVAGGCDGVYITIVLWAAVLGYPGKSSLKILAIYLFGLALFLLNVIRCASLVYIGSIEHNLFNVFHHYIWPTVVIVVTILLFIGWMEISNRYSRLPG